MIKSGVSHCQSEAGTTKTPSNEMSGWTRSPERGLGTGRMGRWRFGSDYRSDRPSAVNNRPLVSRASSSWDRKRTEPKFNTWDSNQRSRPDTEATSVSVFLKLTLGGGFPRRICTWAESVGQAGSWVGAPCWRKWWKGWWEQEGRHQPLKTKT